MKRQNTRYALLCGVACAALMGSNHAAQAFQYRFANGVDIRFDNTIEYSVITRTAPVNRLLGGPTAYNNNDGDDNTRTGIVSNRIDVLSQFEISDAGFGFDGSIDSFYDTVYNQRTQNNNGASYNPAQQPSTKYTTATQTETGRNVELRNLFVYGSHDIDGVPVTVRVGRLVNLFGESLFFAQNGIAYANAPLDIERASSTPNTQAKDLFLPVGQATITVQATDSISVTAYYQFEWEKFNLPATGTFFSGTDILDEGGQRLYVGAAGPNRALYFYRAHDMDGADTGQFGLAVHYDPIGSSFDYGFYALQYNDSEPQVYVRPRVGAPVVVPGTAAGAPIAESLGTYQTVYADHIQIYGASTSTTIGPLNLAGEASVRANEDLVSTVTVPANEQFANNTNHALYAIGDVAHYQVSEIYAGSKLPGFWDGYTITGEAAGENLFAISANKNNFNRATAKHMALGLRTVGSLTYYEALPGLDVSPQIGLGWNFMGKSPDTNAFNTTGIDRGGDITFGIAGTYLNKWTGGIAYTRYISPPARDPKADRDFFSFNVERTF